MGPVAYLLCNALIPFLLMKLFHYKASLYLLYKVTKLRMWIKSARQKYCCENGGAKAVFTVPSDGHGEEVAQTCHPGMHAPNSPDFSAL